MARSDRLKVKRQLEFAVKHIEAIEVCLMDIDRIAHGRSKKIDEALPKLVEMLDLQRKILVQFRREL